MKSIRLCSVVSESGLHQRVYYSPLRDRYFVASKLGVRNLPKHFTFDDVLRFLS